MKNNTLITLAFTILFAFTLFEICKKDDNKSPASAISGFSPETDTI